MKLEKIPFNLIYKTDIIGSKNNEEILNTFFAEEINIVLTIVKSVKIPKSFNSIEPLIEYINMINTQNDDYLSYLYYIYRHYEKMTNNNTSINPKYQTYSVRSTSPTNVQQFYSKIGNRLGNIN